MGYLLAWLLVIGRSHVKVPSTAHSMHKPAYWGYRTPFINHPLYVRSYKPWFYIEHWLRTHFRGEYLRFLLCTWSHTLFTICLIYICPFSGSDGYTLAQWDPLACLVLVSRRSQVQYYVTLKCVIVFHLMHYIAMHNHVTLKCITVLHWNVWMCYIKMHNCVKL